MSDVESLRIASNDTDMDIKLPMPPTDVSSTEESQVKDQIETYKMQGNVAAIVEVMRTHEASSAAQSRACTALWSLAKDKDAKSKIGGAGGCTAILMAMRGHSNDTKVLEAAFGALWSLAADPRNKSDIVTAGGLEVAICLYLCT